MGDKDKPGEDDVNLEMPSLGLSGLRRKRRKGDAGEAETAPPPETTAEESPIAPELSGDPTPEPEPDPTPVEPVEARTSDPETIFDDTPDADDTAREDTTVLPADRPLFVDEESTEPPAQDATYEPSPVPAYSREDERADQVGGVDDDREERERREFRLPAIAPMRAAIVTGLVTGLLAVGLTVLTLRGCELVRGTSSCGGGPGFFLLLAILVVLVVLGGWLLKAWGVPDPMSTSFLAVGLLAVVALLFLVEVLFSPWMLLVVPLVAVGTFALSHWVTTAFIEPAERKDALRDVE